MLPIIALLQPRILTASNQRCHYRIPSTNKLDFLRNQPWWSMWVASRWNPMLSYRVDYNYNDRRNVGWAWSIIMTEGRLGGSGPLWWQREGWVGVVHYDDRGKVGWEWSVIMTEGGWLGVVHYNDRGKVGWEWFIMMIEEIFWRKPWDTLCSSTQLSNIKECEMSFVSYVIVYHSKRFAKRFRWNRVKAKLIQGGLRWNKV